MKRIAVRIITAGLIVAAFLLFMRRADMVLMTKSPHGIDQMRYFYDQEEGSVDVLFLGSSHVHVDVNTALLWEDHGIPAYDLSGAEQPFWMSYHVLIEALKTQRPKLVVLECYTPLAFYDDFHYDHISENILGMRLSPNKLKMLSVSVEPDMLYKYFPGFAVWHGRYETLTDEDRAWPDTAAESRRSFKGYTPYFESEAWERQFYPDAVKQEMTKKQTEYLGKIISLCRGEGIEIALMLSPYVIQSERSAGVIMALEDYATENGVVFLNFNTDEEIGAMRLDFMTDSYDFSHLNYTGSRKFTALLGQRLKELYGLEDRREGREKYNNDSYLSWDIHCDEINEEAKEAA